MKTPKDVFNLSVGDILKIDLLVFRKVFTGRIIKIGIDTSKCL